MIQTKECLYQILYVARLQNDYLGKQHNDKKLKYIKKRTCYAAEAVCVKILK